MREAIGPGPDAPGALVPPDDTEALTAAVVACLADPELARHVRAPGVGTGVEVRSAGLGEGLAALTRPCGGRAECDARPHGLRTVASPCGRRSLEMTRSELAAHLRAQGHDVGVVTLGRAGRRGRRHRGAVRLQPRRVLGARPAPPLRVLHLADLYRFTTRRVCRATRSLGSSCRTWYTPMRCQGCRRRPSRRRRRRCWADVHTIHDHWLVCERLGRCPMQRHVVRVHLRDVQGVEPGPSGGRRATPPVIAPGRVARRGGRARGAPPVDAGTDSVAPPPVPEAPSDLILRHRGGSSGYVRVSRSPRSR